MSQDKPPTALFIANVNAAFGALAEARTIGVRVPEDVSIIAMHEAWSAENSWPPLTTVKMPLYELGTRAVQSLWARLHSGTTLEDLVVSDPPPHLIVRESTARLPPSAMY
jgi:LacI family transcriptional regulator